MRKKVFATILTALTLIASVPVTALATEAPSETETPAAVVANDEPEIAMDILWVAETGTYDVKTNGLDEREPVTLSAGKVYDVAIAMTNTTDEGVAMPWGIDYGIGVSRVIEADGGKSAGIYASVWSDSRNDGAWIRSSDFLPLCASEDVALIYVDQSNYSTELDNGEYADKGLANFVWEKNTRVLGEDSIYLSAGRQGIRAKTSEVITLQVKAIPLVDWYKLEKKMEEDPVNVRIADVYQSLTRESSQKVNATLHLPDWFKEIADGESARWQLMAQPTISEDGDVVVRVMLKNHSSVYAAIDSESLAINTDLLGGNVKRVEFHGAHIGDQTETASLYSTLDGKWVCFDLTDFQSEINIVFSISAISIN